MGNMIVQTLSERLDWAKDNVWLLSEWAGASLLLWIGTLVITAIAIRYYLIWIPADAFAKDHVPFDAWRDSHPAVRWTLLIGKNVIGTILIVAGLVLAVPPGRGWLAWPGLSVVAGGRAGKPSSDRRRPPRLRPPTPSTQSRGPGPQFNLTTKLPPLRRKILRGGLGWGGGTKTFGGAGGWVLGTKTASRRVSHVTGPWVGSEAVRRDDSPRSAAHRRAGFGRPEPGGSRPLANGQCDRIDSAAQVVRPCQVDHPDPPLRLAQPAGMGRSQARRPAGNPRRVEFDSFEPAGLASLRTVSEIRQR